MKQNINIEAEGNELVLKNKAGDYVIIPKKYRTEVQDMIKDGCHGCIDALVETLPVMEDYAQDGSLLPDWDKIKATLNPKNWEVPDYSDKGDFSTAFATARKAGEKEFMWNNTRYTTNKDTDPIIKNPKNEKDIALNNHYKEYYPEFVKNYNSNRPNVNVDPEINRASYYIRSKTLNVQGYDDETGDFIAELAHHKQKTGIKEDIKSTNEYLRYGDDKRYDKEGTIEYDTHRLIEPALYMQRDGNLSKEDILKLQKYLKVKEDGLLGKDTYKAIVDKYYNKDIIKEYLDNSLINDSSKEFKDKIINQKYPDTYDNTMSSFYLSQIGEDPNINLKGLTHNKEYYYGEDDNWEGAYFDDNQLLKLNPNNKNFDTLALQIELSNRGYKLPKSTKKNGTFDGILGDETKNALIDWQTKNKPKPVVDKATELDKYSKFEYKPYVAVQDNTYVAPKVIIPFEQKKKE